MGQQLRAFVDDSGSGGDSPWYVLAGYVGTSEGWESFDSQWRSVLDIAPRVEYFKSTEAESLRPDGQWAGISKESKNQRIDSLIEVIGRCAIRALYVRVRQQDYNEVIKPYVPPEWDNAYYFLFTGAIAAATSIEKYMGSSRPVEFFFDSHEQLEKPSRKLYSQVEAGPQFGRRVADIHYRDEMKVLPLQAADLLAWQVRRRFCANEPPRAHFDRALGCPPEKPYSHTITRDDLEVMGNRMDEVAKLRWASMGMPETQRPWKRPARTAG